MRRRIIVTNNNYLILGLMNLSSFNFSFLSYNDFFVKNMRSDSFESTYIFDVSSSKYEIIKVVNKIKMEDMDLNSNCVILWGNSADIPRISSFMGFNFFDIKVISSKFYLYKSIQTAEAISRRVSGETSLISNRESLVLRKLIRCNSLTSVATSLDRSIKTVSAQKRNVMIKLGLMNETSLFVFIKCFF